MSAYRPDPKVTDRADQPVAATEPTGVLTLRQALVLALARNPALAAASWEVKSGEATALQEGLLPNQWVLLTVRAVIAVAVLAMLLLPRTRRHFQSVSLQ